MKISKSKVLSVAFSLLVSGMFLRPVRADVVYTYTGNQFNQFLNGGACPPTCNVTGSFAVSQALAPNLPLTLITPLSFTISSGSATLTDGDPANTDLYVGTDASGAIDLWTWQVVGPESSPDARIVTQNSPGSVFDDVRYGTQAPPIVGPRVAEIDNDPGSWTATAVPEPGMNLVLLAGLIGAGVITRKRRRPRLEHS